MGLPGQPSVARDEGQATVDGRSDGDDEPDDGERIAQLTPTTKVTDLSLPTPSNTATVSLEQGLFNVSAAGISAQLPVVAPRASGVVGPGALEHDLGIARTQYETVEQVCVQGTCKFATGAEAGPKVGELWTAELTVWAESTSVDAGPVPIVVFEEGATP